MTAILAIVHPRGVVLGSDSRVTTGAEQWDEERPKWARVGRAYVALAGAARLQLLAEAVGRVRAPRAREGAQAYLSLVLAEAIREAAERTKSGAGEGVIVWRRRAYYLDAEYAVTEPAGGIVGAGSGGTAARAAALALADVEPVERVRRALEIAAACVPGVGGPLHVVDVR